MSPWLALLIVLAPLAVAATHRERGDPQTIDSKAAKAMRKHVRTSTRLRALMKRST